MEGKELCFFLFNCSSSRRTFRHLLQLCMWNDYYCVILIKAHVVTTPLPDENFQSLEINIWLDFHCILNWSYCSNFLLTRGRLEHALNTTFDSPMARTTYYILLRVSIAMITWPIPKAYSRNIFKTFSAFLACHVLVGWSAWIYDEEFSLLHCPSMIAPVSIISSLKAAAVYETTRKLLNGWIICSFLKRFCRFKFSY